MNSEKSKAFKRQGPLRRLKGRHSPVRWQKECKIDFPEDKNPWLNIFKKELVKSIAEHIPDFVSTQSDSTEQADQLYELRGQLAGVAEIFHETIRFHGSPAPPNAKRKELETVLKNLEKTRAALEKYRYAHSGHVTTNLEAGKFKIYPATEVTSRIDVFTKELDNFDNFLQNRKSKWVTAREASVEGEKPATHHSMLMQLIVDEMTQVFILFAPKERVGKIYRNDQVEGMYAEFIRSAANPCLSAYYEKEKGKKIGRQLFNAQMQETAKELKRLYE